MSLLSPKNGIMAKKLRKIPFFKRLRDAWFGNFCCLPPHCPPPHRHHHHEADSLGVLDVLAKTPCLYLIPKLRYPYHCCRPCRCPPPRRHPPHHRRLRLVVFELIRGNGNKCNFAQMSCRMANCSQVVFVINTTNEITDFDYF